MNEQKSHNCVNLKISIPFWILTVRMMMAEINLTHSLETEEKHKTSVIIDMTCIILVYFFVYLIILYQLQKKAMQQRITGILWPMKLEIMLQEADTEWFFPAIFIEELKHTIKVLGMHGASKPGVTFMPTKYETKLLTTVLQHSFEPY